MNDNIIGVFIAIVGILLIIFRKSIATVIIRNQVFYFRNEKKVIRDAACMNIVFGIICILIGLSMFLGLLHSKNVY